MKNMLHQLIISVFIRMIATFLVMFGSCAYLFSLPPSHFLNYASREFYYEILQKVRKNDAVKTSGIRIVGLDDKFCDPDAPLNQQSCRPYTALSRLDLADLVKRLSGDLDTSNPSPSAVVFDIILENRECTAEDGTLSLAHALYDLSRKTNLVMPYGYIPGKDGEVIAERTIFEGCEKELRSTHPDFSLNDKAIYFGDPALVDLYASGRTDHIFTHRAMFLLADDVTYRRANIPSLALAAYIASLKKHDEAAINCIDVPKNILNLSNEESQALRSLPKKTTLECLTFAFHLRPTLKYPQKLEIEELDFEAYFNKVSCELLSVPCHSYDNYQNTLKISYRLPLSHKALEEGGFEYRSANLKRLIPSKSQADIIMIGSTNVAYDDLFLTPAGTVSGVAIWGNALHDFRTNGFLKTKNWQKQVWGASKITLFTFTVSTFLSIIIILSFFQSRRRIHKVKHQATFAKVVDDDSRYLADRYSIVWPIGMILTALGVYKWKVFFIETEVASGEISISILLFWASIAAIAPAIEQVILAFLNRKRDNI